MKSRKPTTWLLLPAATLLVMLVAISGCATQQTTDSEPAPTRAGDPDAERKPLSEKSGTEAEPLDDDAVAALEEVVYFDYDRDEVKQEYRELIAAHAQFLRDNPQSRVKLGGHADERGSREYNLALSERRAKAVFNQLMLAGVPEAQLSTAARGEEYPAVDGHNEAAWSKNRRVEFEYQGTHAP